MTESMNGIFPNTDSGWRTALRLGAGTILLAALLVGATVLQQGSRAAAAGAPLDSDQLYRLTNVWTLHLKFTPDQWEAIEPKGGGGPGGRFGGPDNRREDRALSPVLMSQADLNRDGRITAEEFVQLARDWFAAWGGTQTGRLDEGQIRAGLEAIRNPAGSGVSGMLLGAEGKRNGIASAFGIEFDYVRADLEFEGLLLKDVGVRYKGNGTFLESRNSLKRPLKIETDKFVRGQSLAGVKELNLQNNVTDASLMNEVLAYRLYRDAGVPAPRTAYARVFVTVPGLHERRFLGLYSVSEAVDKTFAERHFGTRHGAIFKPVTPSLFTDLGADWAAYNQVYDPKGSAHDEHKAAVMELSRLVTHADDAAFAARIGQFIDLPEFARFLAVMVYLSDLDGILGPGQNLYLHRQPKSGLFTFIPWDQDRSWGQFNRASQDQRDQLSIHRPWQGENHFLERMFKVEAFKRLYLARLDEFATSIFDPERIARQVDEIAAVIRPAVREESDSLLARFDQLVAGKLTGATGPFGGDRTKPIKPFALVRTQSVRDQLAGRSAGLTLGGGFPGGFGGAEGLGRFSRTLMQALDQNRDAAVSEEEFTGGFAALFQAWDRDRAGQLAWIHVRSGVEQDLVPLAQASPGFGGGPRRDRGFAPNRPGPDARPEAPTPGAPPPAEPRR